MYFSFFKLKKWGKKTAEARRHNCAVLPYVLVRSAYLFPIQHRFHQGLQEPEPGFQAADQAVFRYRMAIASNRAQAIQGGDPQGGGEVAIASPAGSLPLEGDTLFLSHLLCQTAEGQGFFCRPHGRTGHAPFHLDLHPVIEGMSCQFPDGPVDPFPFAALFDPHIDDISYHSLKCDC